MWNEMSQYMPKRAVNSESAAIIEGNAAPSARPEPRATAEAAPRGILPPPEIRGRTGYYGPEHVARLELIGEMQADGFNLQAIKRLVEGSNGAVEQVLDFRRALMTPFEEEEPEFVTQDEIEERW